MPAYLHLFFILIAFGFIAYLVLTYIPMASPIKEVVTVGIVVILILFILNVLGFWGPAIKVC